MISEIDFKEGDMVLWDPGPSGRIKHGDKIHKAIYIKGKKVIYGHSFVYLPGRDAVACVNNKRLTRAV